MLKATMLDLLREYEDLAYRRAYNEHYIVKKDCYLQMEKIKGKLEAYTSPAIVEDICNHIEESILGEA